MLRACLLLFCIALAGSAHAANTPCSGSKGGIAHCAGERFVCNDGSISASKRICTGYNAATPAALQPAAEDTGSSCPCSSGRICTGPRGGRYCLTPSGNKSYLRR